MRRRYTAAQFVAKVEPVADFNLTTDVIVGFPAEDEAAFGGRSRSSRSRGMTKVHVFPYSPRPGTDHCRRRHTVPAQSKKERGARLRALSDELCRRRRAAELGTTDHVLVDRPDAATRMTTRRGSSTPRSAGS